MQKLKNNIGKLSDQIDKERRTIGERGARTRKKRRAERKKARNVYNKKMRQITRRRAKGK